MTQKRKNAANPELRTRIGMELRRVRQQRGRTRGHLVKHLPTTMSVQTLTTYELGTRAMTVDRLFEVCMELEMSPSEVLAAAERALLPEERGIVVDLQAVMNSAEPALHQLRAWAKARAEQASTITLTEEAVEPLAALAGVSVLDLRRALRRASAT